MAETNNGLASMMKSYRESKELPYDEMPNDSIQFSDNDMYVFLSENPYVYEDITVYGFLRYGNGRNKFITTEMAKYLYDKLKLSLNQKEAKP